MQSVKTNRAGGALILMILFLAVAVLNSASAADGIEFLNGAKLNGRILRVDSEKHEVSLEVTIAGSTRARTYPYNKIHRLWLNGVEREITPKNEVSGVEPADGSNGETVPTRSVAEVRQLIASEGSAAPDWLESTPLVFPKTLDLNWPMPAPQPWNNQKNLGQYIWDRVNPNAGQWQGGIRLMVDLLGRHAKEPEVQRRVMQSLGGMYFRFFQDYIRAAYWWQKAGVAGGDHDTIGLAECYFRLGCRELAEEVLRSSGISPGKIKLLGQMGDVDEALRQADLFAVRSQQPHEAWLVAGDICRVAHRFEKAIEYYQKVVEGPHARNEDYDKRYRGRATDSIEFIRRFELLDLSSIPDGVYRGSSLGYEAPVHVAATVKSGRIDRVEITQHREKQYYSALRDVPAQIVRKQDLKDVDATSRATITGVAIINATAKALAARARD
jgi:uncharacterized protein with FMN-binding domain